MFPMMFMKENEEYTWQYKLDLVVDGDTDWWMSSYSYANNYAAVPLWFPKGVYITVNWGDGTTETIEGVSNGRSNLEIPSQLLHQYNYGHAYWSYTNEERYPTISITSRQWDKIWLCGGDPGNGGEPSNSYYYFWSKHSTYIPDLFYKDMDYYSENYFGFDYDGGFTNAIQGLVSNMRMCCIEIITPLPHVAGILISDTTKCSNTFSTDDMPYEGFFDDGTIYPYGTFVPNSMFYAFGYYYRMKKAPADLFKYNLNAKDFTNCLWEVPASGINYPISKDRMFNSELNESNPYH